MDGHSAIVSHALLAETPQARAQDGWSGDGRLQRRAKHTVSDRLADLVGPGAAARRGPRRRSRRWPRSGIGAFHENAAPHIGPDYEVALVRQAADEAGLHATLYWGELGASTGPASSASPASPATCSPTARSARAPPRCARRTPTAGHCGHGYLDRRAGRRARRRLHRARACRRGFHCIGDARARRRRARASSAAAEQLGDDACAPPGTGSSTSRCVDKAMIARFARLGVVASVQPAFDAAVGRPGRHVRRAAGRRAGAGMNPFGALPAPAWRWPSARTRR